MAVSFYKNMSRANAEAGLDVSGGQVPLGGLMFTVTGEIYLQTGTVYGNPNSSVAAERKSPSVVAYGSVSDVSNLQTALATAQSAITSLGSRLNGVEANLGDSSQDGKWDDYFGTKTIYDALVFLYESQESSLISVDTTLSSTSTNPVQNKAVKAALDGKAASVHTHEMANITGLAAALANKQGLIDGTPLTNKNINQYAAYQITLAGTPYEHNNGIFVITGPNIVTALGSLAVARAAADASGNNIANTYATQTSLSTANTNITNLGNRVGAVESEIGNQAARDAYEGKFGTQSIFAALVYLLDNAQHITIDTTLSSTSTNPVQNKAVKTALGGKADASHQHAMSDVQGLSAELALKQTVIQDLDTIRQNAQNASTALQPSAISDMATKTWVSSQQYATTDEFDPENGNGVVETEELDMYHDMGSVRTKSVLQTMPASSVVLRGIIKDEETGDKYVAFPNAIVLEYASSAFGRNQYIFLAGDAVTLQEFKTEVDSGKTSMFDGKGYPKVGALYAPGLNFNSANDVIFVPVVKDSTHICIALVENASGGKVYFLNKSATDTIKIQTSESQVFQHCVARSVGAGIPSTATALPSNTIYWDLFAKVAQTDAYSKSEVYTKTETDNAFLKKTDASNTYETKSSLKAAAYKEVDTSMPTSPTDTKVLTTKAVKTYVESVKTSIETATATQLGNLDNSIEVKIVNAVHELGSIYHPRGTVQSESDLEGLSASARVGDVYNVADTGMNYVYIGEKFNFSFTEQSKSWNNAEPNAKSSITLNVYLGAAASSPTAVYLRCLPDGHLIAVSNSGAEYTYSGNVSNEERYSEIYKSSGKYYAYKMSDNRAGSAVFGSGTYHWDSFGATINLEWH